MKYCKRCLQPDTRPNTLFTPEGICPACDYFERLQHVDWQERYEILQDLLEGFPRIPGRHFDCIIGVSGGKDSTRQALWVRDKLGLRPLLTCLSYPPQQVTQRGVDNISNLIELGFDVVLSAPAPGTWQRLMRESFRLHQLELVGPVDLVLVARPSIAGKSFEVVQRDFMAALRKAGLIGTAT